MPRRLAWCAIIALSATVSRSLTSSAVRLRPSRNTAQPRVLLDARERLTRVRTPIMDLDGNLTPTPLTYVVQHFAVPEPTTQEAWRLAVEGEIKKPLSLRYEDIRQLPARRGLVSIGDLRLPLNRIAVPQVFRLHFI